MKALLLALATLIPAQAHAIQIPEGFRQEQVQLPTVRLNVYKGGSGEAVVLIHGYAESALMWEKAMSRLREKYTVIVPDLRGAGLSEVTEGGYRKAELARDIKQLLDHYGIEKARIVGHDIGLMVAYAFAAQYPEATTKLAVMDAFLPGVGPGEAIYNSADIWHFRFHGAFAEELVKGREKLYLDALWTNFSANPASFPEAKKDYFAAQYAAPGHMKAGFEYFRAFPQDALDNQEFAKTPLTIPVLSIGGEKAMGAPLAASTLLVAPHAQTVVLKNAGHWLMEESPEATLDVLTAFLK